MYIEKIDEFTELLEQKFVNDDLTLEEANDLLYMFQNDVLEESAQLIVEAYRNNIYTKEEAETLVGLLFPEPEEDILNESQKDMTDEEFEKKRKEEIKKKVSNILKKSLIVGGAIGVGALAYNAVNGPNAKVNKVKKDIMNGDKYNKDRYDAAQAYDKRTKDNYDSFMGILSGNPSNEDYISALKKLRQNQEDNEKRFKISIDNINGQAERAAEKAGSVVKQQEMDKLVRRHMAKGDYSHKSIERLINSARNINSTKAYN